MLAPALFVLLVKEQEKYMDFNRSFFEDEVRNGFYVPAEMKQAWAAQMEVLSDLDRACSENGIEYYADLGTLLGAVRHQGFIPWDDDIDICMKRHDYNRFIKLAKQIMPEGYDIYNIENDEKNDNMLTRIINGRSISFEEDRLKKYHGFPYVAGIDIFPLDYIAPQKEEAEFQRTIIAIVNSVKFLVREMENSKDDQFKTEKKEEIDRYIKEIEQLCGVNIDKDKKLAQQLNILMDRLCSLYTEDEAKEIAELPMWLKDGRYKFPKEYFTKSIRLKFENFMIPVSREYDKILKEYYGDYNKIVLECEDAHSYPFYKDNKKIALDAGANLCVFKSDITVYNMISKQKEILRKAREITNMGIKKKKKIVFMPFKAKYWKTMKPLWEKYIKDKSYEVIVQPIPFYYKNIDGTIEEYIEKEFYPSEVIITSYNEYDCYKEMPDEIVIQNPYDEYNVATMVNPNFFSKNLIMCTDKLTYIPYFITNEIAWDDMQSDSSMDSYVTMPGVVYSDRVILQSENIKKLYVRKLVEFYGEDTRNEWESKLCTTF